MEPEPAKNPDDDLDGLIQRAKAGDKSAQEKIIAQHLDAIRALVRHKLGAKLKARVEEEDLVQTAMIEVIRDLNKVEFRGRDAFFQWLAQLVHNKIRDKAEYFERMKRDVRREKVISHGEDTSTSTSGGTPAGAIAANTRGPLTRVGDWEEQERLQRALRELPEDLRFIVTEKQYNNKSLREIADQLGVSEGIVTRRLVKALETLRRSLKEPDK